MQKPRRWLLSAAAAAVVAAIGTGNSAQVGEVETGLERLAGRLRAGAGVVLVEAHDGDA